MVQNLNYLPEVRVLKERDKVFIGGRMAVLSEYESKQVREFMKCCKW